MTQISSAHLLCVSLSSRQLNTADRAIRNLLVRTCELPALLSMIPTITPHKLRVLCVEDHEDTLELITLVLENQFDVTAARSIQSAWKLVQHGGFDLLLLDSWLVDGSGLTLCRRIREIDQITPILFYSAAAYEVDRESALRAGAQGYLIKPASLSELCDSVARLIRTQQMARSGD